MILVLKTPRRVGLSLPAASKRFAPTSEADPQSALITGIERTEPVGTTDPTVAATGLPKPPQSTFEAVNAPRPLKQLASLAAMQQLAEVYEALDEREMVLHYVNSENMRVKKQVETQHTELAELRAKCQSLSTELFELKSNFSILKAEQVNAEGENEFLRHEREVHQQYGRTPKSAVRRLLLPMRNAGAENAPQSPLQQLFSITKATPKSTLRRSLLAARNDGHDNAPQSPLVARLSLLHAVPEEPAALPEANACAASCARDDASVNARMQESYCTTTYHWRALLLVSQLAPIVCFYSPAFPYKLSPHNRS